MSQGKVTRAALIVEIDGKLYQVALKTEESLLLVNMAKAFGDPIRVIGPIESISLSAPAARPTSA